jgi:hypothetical protein
MAQFGLSWAFLRREETEYRKHKDIPGRVQREAKKVKTNWSMWVFSDYNFCERQSIFLYFVKTYYFLS